MCLLISCTCKDEVEARKISNLLLEKRFAACIQFEKITSFYVWQGKIVSEPEIKLVIKTLATLYQQVEQVILENHSYEVPEIIAHKIENGSASYLDWINSVLRKN